MPEIDESATCGQALCQILTRLLDELTLNEAGVRAAADMGSLHNYRVAIRRARVVVRLFGEIMPAHSADYFSTELRWLGQLTSPLRDADTQLAALAGYNKWLPEELSSSLERFHSHLQQVHISERGKIMTALAGKRYELFMAYWRAFVANGPAGWNNRAWTIYAGVAGREIWRQYRRMVRRGRDIGAGAPAGTLHELRKDGKKLRYLIEFFDMAAHGGEAEKLLKQLRRLQDVLGAHQDYEVHADTILKFCEQLALDESASYKDFLALGVLTGRLNGLQAAARDNFSARFKKFSSKRSKRDFRILCNIAENEKPDQTPVSVF